MWLGVDLRTGTKNTCVYKRLEYVLNIQHVCWGGGVWGMWFLYDQSMSTGIVTFIMNKIFIWDPKIMRQMATGMFWICKLSCTNCVFNILREVGTERKSIHVKACIPYSIHTPSSLLCVQGSPKKRPMSFPGEIIIHSSNIQIQMSPSCSI